MFAPYGVFGSFGSPTLRLPSPMPLSLTTVERRILTVLAALIVLGLIGYAVL